MQHSRPWGEEGLACTAGPSDEALQCPSGLAQESADCKHHRECQGESSRQDLDPRNGLAVAVYIHTNRHRAGRWGADQNCSGLVAGIFFTPVVQAHSHLPSPCHVLVTEAAREALGSSGNVHLTTCCAYQPSPSSHSTTLNTYCGTDFALSKIHPHLYL
ncbi:uncharacterized protein [Kogia breviceps]|uniref:uncharacterized protein isoform X7 n=1 Tax=Kogia breviceps TaxID=27615 RepID=UPI0034D2D3B4